MGKGGATSLTGAAGEHLVMSRLLSRGYIAALAPQGVPNFDIVATSVAGDHLCAFQVTTRWAIGSDGGWHMRPKHETLSDERIFYCCVDLGRTPGDVPSVHVIPSGVVAQVIALSHKIWLDLPGKKGQPHKDSAVRRLLPDYTKVLGAHSPYSSGWLAPYLENWDQLKSLTVPASDDIGKGEG